LQIAGARAVYHASTGERVHGIEDVQDIEDLIVEEDETAREDDEARDRGSRIATRGRWKRNASSSCR
jgi:hypothetical protein